MLIYNKMYQIDVMSMKDIDRLNLERKKCVQKLRQLNNKLMDIEMECGQTLGKLRQERKHLESIYWDMKNQALKKSVKIDRIRLRQMTTVSDQSIKVRDFDYAFLYH